MKLQEFHQRLQKIKQWSSRGVVIGIFLIVALFSSDMVILRVCSDEWADKYFAVWFAYHLAIAVAALVVIISSMGMSIRRYGVKCHACGKQLCLPRSAEIVIASRHCCFCGQRVLDENDQESQQVGGANSGSAAASPE